MEDPPHYSPPPVFSHVLTPFYYVFNPTNNDTPDLPFKTVKKSTGFRVVIIHLLQYLYTDDGDLNDGKGFGQYCNKFDKGLIGNLNEWLNKYLFRAI